VEFSFYLGEKWRRRLGRLFWQNRLLNVALFSFLVGPFFALADPIAAKPASPLNPVSSFDEREPAPRPKLAPLSRLSAGQMENLATLARVWGFLKYYDPRVVGGSVPWDEELFRVLPEVIAAKDRDASNEIIFNWVCHLDRFGPLEDDPLPSIFRDECVLEPDLKWLSERSLLGEALSKRLQLIQKQPRSSEKSAFIQFNENGVPKFDGEAPYPKNEFPDAGFQLLALFRYWNVIEYWYPYRDIATEDWPRVLSTSIPRFAAAKSFSDYQRELLRLAAHVHDSHAVVVSAKPLLPPEGPGALPVRIRFLGSEAVVDQLQDTSTSAESLRVGDVILEQDGRATSALVAECTPFYAASNEEVLQRNIARNFTRGPIGAVTLKIRRSGREQTVTVQRHEAPFFPLADETHVLAGDAFQLLSPGVAYLKICDSKQADIASYLEKAKNTQGWILDFRGYPRDNTAFFLSPHFVAEGTAFSWIASDDPAEPGATRRRQQRVRLSSRTPYYSGKRVILVDEDTQSAAEFAGMMFRASPGAVVIGSTTAGADGNVSVVPLPGYQEAHITGIAVYYPDGRPTQRVGIIPDMVVKPTVEDIADGRDVVLEAAWKVITGQNPTRDKTGYLFTGASGPSVMSSPR
jgi:C-terminal processing protease CtpA/Prc